MKAQGPLLVIIGAPGAGKTQIGRRVARLLRTPFVDTDRRIVAGHGPITKLFTEFGEDHFREIERAEVSKALGERAVIALGGGSILNQDTRRDLQGLRVALMTVSAEAVALRIAGAKRPLLRGGLDSWRWLVDARRELYESLASRTWDTSDRSIEDIASEIAEWVRTEE